MTRIDVTSSIATCLAIVLILGCDASTSKALRDSKTDDQSTREKLSTEPFNLGWLGATAVPVKSVVKSDQFLDAKNKVDSGGIIVVEVTPGAAFSSAGIRTGDTIVRVAENRLPIKKNSILDFIERVEDEIDKQNKSVHVTVVRNAKLLDVVLAVERPSIDEGLPLVSNRIVDSTKLALDHLASIQNENGSFPTQHNTLDSWLISTSLAGLAFLAADESISDRYQGNTNKCLGFVSSSLADGKSSTINPLAAGYVLQFIAESQIDFLDGNWLDVVIELNELLSTQQNENGSWIFEFQGSTKEEANPIDVPATFTTNQVVLAIGALERKGFEPDTRTLQRACKFLDDQSHVKVSSRLDRRLKASLSAGTAAALIAINCNRNNAKLKTYADEALARVKDTYTSPSLAWPGFLHTAILARQLGNDTWINFHNATKYFAISILKPNGMIADSAMSLADQLSFELWVDQEIWQTTHFVISQSLQSQTLQRSLALVSNDESVERDHLGKTFVPPAINSDDSEQARKRAELTKMIMDMINETFGQQKNSSGGSSDNTPGEEQ